MSFSYPEESQKLDIIGHLEELRKRMLLSIIVPVMFTIQMPVLLKRRYLRKNGSMGLYESK